MATVTRDLQPQESSAITFFQRQQAAMQASDPYHESKNDTVDFDDVLDYLDTHPEAYLQTA